MIRRIPKAGFASLLLIALLLAVVRTSGQSSTPVAESDIGNGGFVVRDSNVGYIDSAVIGNVVRLRSDAAYGFDRPNRAEYFYAASQPAGPGLPLAEFAVDYQDLLLYLERKTNECLSLFAELGVRSLDPIINQNTSGLSDVNAGIKRETGRTRVLDRQPRSLRRVRSRLNG